MRYYLDEDLPPRVAVMARARGLDVVSAQELRRFGLDDDQQLLLAASDGRCFVTRNARDFRRLTAEFYEAGLPHAGVLCLSESLQSYQFAAIVAALGQHDRDNPDGIAAYVIDYLRRVQEDP